MLANRDKIGEWEKWKVIRNADGSVSLQTLSGNYLCVEKDDRKVVADREAIGEWEKFTVTEIDGVWSFTCWNGKFLSAQSC